VIWLGDERGFLTDWLTQQWVRATGRRVDLSDQSWLDGPVGNTTGIGSNFFTEYAKERDLEVVREGRRGLIARFSDLNVSGRNVAGAVRDFYESTSEYELDAWSEWSGAFKPFGSALALLFSRRLQQLNVPLSSLDTSRGMTSEVEQFRDRKRAEIVHTAWVRKLIGTNNILYAGAYSLCKVPNHGHPCVKVVFPLPNGNAIVVMKPEFLPDGSVRVVSSGREFGDPGFYFVVHGKDKQAWARFVFSLKEMIHVYPDGADTVRADHCLWIWGAEFLRLHYRMRLRMDSTDRTLVQLGHTV